MIGTQDTKAILVVDDNEDLRQAAVALLCELGYIVSEATDGPSALKVLGRVGKHVDLVFSDVYMPPGMDGFELAQEMRRKYPHIKTLLTSGFSKLFFDRGRIDGTEFTVLSRPYMRVDLAEAVQAALDQ